MPWQPNPELLQQLANKAAVRLADNPPNRVAVLREVVRGAPKDKRPEYLTAVAHELSMRRHINRAKGLPDAPKEPPSTPPPQEPQLGFGFGEGPRSTQIRPPTRRHL